MQVTFNNHVTKHSGNNTWNSNVEDLHYTLLQIPVVLLCMFYTNSLGLHDHFKLRDIGFC